uniref:Nucleoid-associated protein n=1 Tax=Palpitomonas bilix TaxID=652834 RepID=A0A7S3G6Y5_9EUKA|mmetsp:Transcript_2450/g.5097  ORF Transcript_2450/g.5097 Transcript_2450/m.5097 type:complete len:106 (+) Transcript_2450:353-670(+)
MAGIWGLLGKEMQEKMPALMESMKALQEKTVSASSDCKRVTAVYTIAGRMQELRISEDLKGQKELLELVIQDAMENALVEIDRERKIELSKMVEQLPPGMRPPNL